MEININTKKHSLATRTGKVKIPNALLGNSTVQIENPWRNLRSFFLEIDTKGIFFIFEDFSNLNRSIDFSMPLVKQIANSPNHLFARTPDAKIYEIYPGMTVEFYSKSISKIYWKTIVPHRDSEVSQALNVIKNCIEENLNRRNTNKANVLLSGGRDSVFLCTVLKKILKCDVRAVHVQDSRNETSRDTKIAIDFCKLHNIPLKIFDISAYTSRLGVSSRIVRHSMPSQAFFPDMSHDITDYFGSESLWTGQGGDQIFGEFSSDISPHIQTPSEERRMNHIVNWCNFANIELGSDKFNSLMQDSEKGKLVVKDTFLNQKQILRNRYVTDNDLLWPQPDQDQYTNIFSKLLPGDALRFINMLQARKTNFGGNNVHYQDEITVFTDPKVCEYFSSMYQDVHLSDSIQRAFLVKMMHEVGVDNAYINHTKDFINANAVIDATNQDFEEIYRFLSESLLAKNDLLDLDTIMKDKLNGDLKNYYSDLWNILRLEIYLDNLTMPQKFIRPRVRQ